MMIEAMQGYVSAQKEFAGMIELHGPGMTIGKTPGVSINVTAHNPRLDQTDPMSFPTVSSKHAEIRANIGDIEKPNWGKQFTAVFEDTSTNGTSLNGKNYRKNTIKELQEGDQIELGKQKETSFVFVSVTSLRLLPRCCFCLCDTCG